MTPQCSPSRWQHTGTPANEPRLTLGSVLFTALVVGLGGTILMPLIAYSGKAIHAALERNGETAYTFLLFALSAAFGIWALTKAVSHAVGTLAAARREQLLRELATEAALLQMAQAMPTSGFATENWSRSRQPKLGTTHGYGAYERQLLPAKSEDYHDCGRCGKPQNDNEVCWYCHDYLCRVCWDKCGHCGHEEAEAFLDAAFVLEVGDGGISLSTDD